MDTAQGGAGRLVEHANRQSCCLQLDSGRLLDQIIRDFVILEFIVRRRIGELARARSNIEGEALHTRQRFIRGTGSERGSVDKRPRLDR